MTNWYKNMRKNWEDCQGLNDEQRKSIAEMIRAVDNVTTTISECYDLNLSDIRELESARWSLYRLLPTEEPSE